MICLWFRQIGQQVCQRIHNTRGVNVVPADISQLRQITSCMTFFGLQAWNMLGGQIYVGASKLFDGAEIRPAQYVANLPVELRNLSKPVADTLNFSDSHIKRAEMEGWGPLAP